MSDQSPILGRVGSATADRPDADRFSHDLERLTGVFDSTPVGVGGWSVEGRLLYANPVLAALVGAQHRAQLVGADLVDYLDSDAVESATRKLGDIWAGRRNHFECHLRGLRPDGSALWLRTHVAAVYGADGEPAYLLSQIFDFAGRDGRDERLRRLADNTPVMLWLTDETGFPRLGNRLAFEFIGVHQPTDDLGRVWADAVHPADLAGAEPRLAARIAGNLPFDFVARSRRRDGEWRWLHHFARPIVDAQGAFEGYAGASVDVTDFERTRRDLHDSEELFASIAESGPLAVARTDVDGKLTYLNGRWGELVEDPQERLTGFGWQDVLLPEYVARINELGVESLHTREPFHLRVRARPHDGDPETGAEGGPWGELRAAPIFDADGQHAGFTASLIDVTGEVEAAHRADKLAQVLDASSDYVLLAGLTGAITYANDAAVRALGVRVSPSEADGSYLWDVLDREAVEVYYDVIEGVLAREGVWRGELALRAVDGGGDTMRTVPVSALFLAHTDEFGGIESISAVARDITELKDAELRLRHLATHDNLTGLPNRALLYDRLDQALARYHRLGHGVALFFCDLDQFKPVNDEFGHDSGDRVLRVIADRIGEVVRATDTAARVGGDEFVVLVEGVDDLGLLRGVAQRLITSISQPVQLAEGTAQVGVSVGLVLAADGRDDVDTLMRLADRAMYRAKAGGRGRVELFDGS